MSIRSGIGFDVHPLVKGRSLVLGGVTIPHDEGLEGHSDGDVLTHAVIDAMFGGSGLGDIGTHFPSSDPRYKGVKSLSLLDRSSELIAADGWRVTYVDATIVAQKPALSPFVKQMKDALSGQLGLDAGAVNVKAKTTDGLGLIGREEGIAALAIATLEFAE